MLVISSGQKSCRLGVTPNHSVADPILLSDLAICRTSLIQPPPFFYGIVSLAALIFALAFLTAGNLSFAPGEHLVITDRTIFKLSPSHARFARQSLQASGLFCETRARRRQPSSPRIAANHCRAWTSSCASVSEHQRVPQSWCSIRTSPSLGSYQKRQAGPPVVSSTS